MVKWIFHTTWTGGFVNFLNPLFWFTQAQLHDFLADYWRDNPKFNAMKAIIKLQEHNATFYYSAVILNHFWLCMVD